jgi:hypothetical protein
MSNTYTYKFTDPNRMMSTKLEASSAPAAGLNCAGSGMAYTVTITGHCPAAQLGDVQGFLDAVEAAVGPLDLPAITKAIRDALDAKRSAFATELEKLAFGFKKAPGEQRGIGVESQSLGGK